MYSSVNKFWVLEPQKMTNSSLIRISIYTHLNAVICGCSIECVNWPEVYKFIHLQLHFYTFIHLFILLFIYLFLSLLL